MSHPVTIFTGQWADLPLAELAPKIASFGYDGLELACWGDHMDVFKAATDKKYCKAQLKVLEKSGLKCTRTTTAVRTASAWFRKNATASPKRSANGPSNP